MGKINIAIIGMGNCTSSFVHGVQHCKDARVNGFVPGLPHGNLCGSCGDS